MKQGDAHGYYSLLGVPANASASEIKTAYRTKAKECHPDSGLVNDGGRKFKAISAAYAILSDPDKRAEYDSLSATVQSESAAQSREISPIACGKCGQVTAQPRYIVFRHVVSLIVTTIRTPVQGIYCSSCAKSAAIRATLITSVFGWWGVPWGPIFTIVESLKNAFGGTSLQSNEEQLLWHNALAFTSRGDGRIALGLIERLKNATDETILKHSRELADILQSQGVSLDAAVLKNPWKFDPVHSLIHIAAVAVLPLIVAYSFYQSDASTPNYSAPYGTSTGPYSPPPVDQLDGTSNALGKNDQPPPDVPTCKALPPNGKVFSGRKRLLAKGHILQIQNGSGGDAIVKVRNSTTNHLLASFFAANNQTASLEGIPDGTYTIQYAFGPNLAVDCKSFTSITSAGQFPQAESLITERTEDFLGTQIKRARISYTLYAVPGGNVRPDSLDPSAFNNE